MAEYRYLFADLQTGAVQAELPLDGVSLQRLLNGAGRFSGKIQMNDTRVRKAFDESATQSGRSAMICLRDEAIVGSWIVWTRRYQFATGVVQFSGAEWWSAFARRKITSDHSWNGASVESAVAALVTDAQDGTGGDFGMTVTGTTGLTVTTSVTAADRPWASEAILSVLDAAGDGVEYETNSAYSGTSILPFLNLGSPSLGRTGTVSNLTVAEPIDGEWTEDATAWATQVTASGRQGGSTALTATATNSSALAAGFPRWDFDFISESDQATGSLASAATRALSERAPGGAFGPVTCRATDPDVSQVRLGDVALVTLPPSERFPDGLSSEVRIMGWTLRPGESGGIDLLTLEVLE